MGLRKDFREAKLEIIKKIIGVSALVIAVF